MSIDIMIKSKFSVNETERLIENTIKDVKDKYGDRFWISDVGESSDLSKTIFSEDFSFNVKSDFLIRDNPKIFDGLDEVARMFRSAIGQENAMVIYGDTYKPFPESDYPSFPNSAYP